VDVSFKEKSYYIANTKPGGELRSLRAGPLFSPGTPVSTTYKTYLHDITELLLNVMLNTIILVLIQNQKTLYMIAKNGLKHSQ
jgi:hypothetical protein